MRKCSVDSLNSIFAEIAKYPADDVMLIGGGSLYNALPDYCTRAYVTLIDAQTEGADTFIPDFSRREGWSLESVSEPLETGGYTIRFAVYLNHNVKIFE